jgi:hypothetical protein
LDAVAPGRPLRAAGARNQLKKSRRQSCTVNGPGLVYIFLSTIISLNSEIACDGFSPFGQALAQFIMVWQR